MSIWARTQWNVANAVTVARIVLVPVFLVLMLADGGHRPALRWAAFAVFALAALTDRLDGQLARSRGIVTDLGKLLDPIADKALIGAALIALSALGDLPWWVTVVILVRELGITLMRFAVLDDGVIPASRGGKLKTVVQALAIGLFIMPLDHLPAFVGVVAWVLMVLAVVLTVVTGVEYVVQVVRAHASRAGGVDR